jgi:drug/metabolite transporter (DMT)-like permease
MTLIVFTLVSTAAILHVLWNSLIKTCTDKASFAWLSSLGSCLLLVPVFIFYRLWSPGPLGWEVWLWAAFSGLFEAFYVIFLFAAYGRADLSVVYPLSRGIAPLITMVLGDVWVGDAITLHQSLAIGTIFTGVAAVSYSARTTAKQYNAWSGICLAVATGCMIAGYHLVDRKAMRMVCPPNPAEYLFLMHFFLTAFITVFVALGLKHGKKMLSEWSHNRNSVLAVSLCTPLAYFLIILALRYGNVTHVTASRNIGILISILVGGLFLKENFRPLKIIGALMIATGVAVLIVLT